jgi:oxygen-independent coproporphyrinogen-3 oxidase
VGFSIEGHESYYNIYMMEEIQTIFAVGAGAVTKLVKCDKPFVDKALIKRISRPKYPYEYLRDDSEESKAKHREEILSFFASEDN